MECQQEPSHFFLRKTYLFSLFPRAEKARDFSLVEAGKFKQKIPKAFFGWRGNEVRKEGLNGAWPSLLPYHIRRFKRRRGEKGAREKKEKKYEGGGAEANVFRRALSPKSMEITKLANKKTETFLSLLTCIFLTQVFLSLSLSLSFFFF